MKRMITVRALGVKCARRGARELIACFVAAAASKPSQSSR